MLLRETFLGNYSDTVHHLSVSFSSVRIPIQQSLPSFQHATKDRKRTKPRRRRHTWTSLFWSTMLLFTLSSASLAHALPGTNHAIVPGEASLDLTHQQAYVDAAVDASVSTSSGSPYPIALNATAENPPYAKLRCLPYCFVADTDSIPFVLDTGANHVIINNAKLFKHFKSRKGNVKGIGGAPVKLCGGGTVNISLKVDDGTITDVSIDDAVYVPTSPFNLISPQILISKMRHDGHYVKYAKHDDCKYIFSYGAAVQSKLKTLTVPIGVNTLFTMRTNEGYNSFFRQSQEFDPEWSDFAGASHVIPDDDASESKPIEHQREHSSSQS
jgi:hypothetical protein